MPYISKILTLLALPLGISLLLMPLGMIFIAWRRKRFGWGLVLVSYCWLLAWSLPVASVPLRASLERRFTQRAPQDFAVAGAIVVLGGGVQGARAGFRSGPHLIPGADRLFFGAQLYRAGRAPLVILSGGNSAWSRSDESEAFAMQTIERDLGVPDSAMLLEDRSQNTEENAAYTKQLLLEHGIAKVILVTSALHMPRALSLFRAQGIDAEPAPTDFDALPAGGLQNWLPDVETLYASSKAMKEYIALTVNNVKETFR